MKGELSLRVVIRCLKRTASRASGRGGGATGERLLLDGVGEVRKQIEAINIIVLRSCFDVLGRIC